jgi:transposase
VTRAKAWVGVDAGKQHHWAVVVDPDGAVLLSRRVGNDEQAILELLVVAGDLADELIWAVDLARGYSALLLAVLWGHRQQVIYVPGRAVNRASDGYRGEGKTDAKDARVIADQARMRRDFAALTPPGELLAELRLLVAHRRDLQADRVRLIGRLREHLVAVFPTLEAAVEVTRKGPLLLLCGWQTPGGVRRAGVEQLTAWLRERGVRKASALARTALAAADQQTVRLPAEDLAAGIVAELARQVLDLDQRIDDLDEVLNARLRRHPQAKILTSLPGIGVLLAAEFLVAVGDLASFASANHLAAYAGLAPVAWDSGRRSGALRRPQRYNRILLRVFYLSALISAQRPGLSRDYYQRKRREGKGHVQAVLALARRRVSVLWALLRDNRPFTPVPPAEPATA